MPDVTVGLVPVGGTRFSIVVRDPLAAPHQGPTIGDDLGGYDTPALRKALAESHGLSEMDVDRLIAAADAKRVSGG